MRHTLLAAAAIWALAAGGAAAQPTPAEAPAAAPPASTPAAAAPVAPPTAEERARLVAAAERGRLLFELTRAAQLTTRDMLARIPDPNAAGISGWVAAPEGEALTVVYYADTPEGPVAVYRGTVADGRITGQQVFAGAERPALGAALRRMAAARAAVADLDRQPCPADATFNVLVVPPASDDAPIDVYKLSPQTQRDKVPLGGHFLASVAPDGTVGAARGFTNRCLDLELPSETALVGAPPPPPIAVTHLLDPLPTEIHVFLSLWTNRPLLVATGNPDRLWTIARGRIGLVGATRTPPPGPGR